MFYSRTYVLYTLCIIHYRYNIFGKNKILILVLVKMPQLSEQLRKYNNPKKLLFLTNRSYETVLRNGPFFGTAFFKTAFLKVL